jgi:hypothetical protein
MVRYRAKFTQRLSAPGRHDLIGAGPNREQEVLLIRPTGNETSLTISGRREPSCDGTSRMNREVHVRNL